MCLFEKVCSVKKESRAKFCMDLNTNGRHDFRITNEMVQLVWLVKKGPVDI